MDWGIKENRIGVAALNPLRPFNLPPKYVTWTVFCRCSTKNIIQHAQRRSKGLRKKVHYWENIQPQNDRIYAHIAFNKPLKR